MKIVIDEIRWEVMAADDFKATCGDYLLRAEQVGKDQWWWMTYFNGDELKVESWASTEEEAMDRAELAMLRHKLVSQQPIKGEAQQRFKDAKDHLAKYYYSYEISQAHWDALKIAAGLQQIPDEKGGEG